ncbi:MAG: prepilin-type N-terminal cleavage/methylation domain-containing protein [Clostridia bacterium]
MRIKLKNKNQGITLISIIITIVLMLILASVAVNVSLGGGLFDYTSKAKFRTEVLSIKEEFQQKTAINGENLPDGDLQTVLGIKNDYQNMLKIENR